MVKTLTSSAGTGGLIPSWGTKIPHAVQYSPQKMIISHAYFYMVQLIRLDLYTIERANMASVIYLRS